VDGQDEAAALDFEQAFKELEALVERLEREEVGLEESLRAFERGLALHRACQQALDAAERKVEILARRDAVLQPQPFVADER
jgi:exodeoxyribonuclease VII small subunit